MKLNKKIITLLIAGLTLGGCGDNKDKGDGSNAGTDPGNKPTDPGGNTGVTDSSQKAPATYDKELKIPAADYKEFAEVADMSKFKEILETKFKMESDEKVGYKLQPADADNFCNKAYTYSENDKAVDNLKNRQGLYQFKSFLVSSNPTAFRIKVDLSQLTNVDNCFQGMNINNSHFTSDIDISKATSANGFMSFVNFSSNIKSIIIKAKKDVKGASIVNGLFGTKEITVSMKSADGKKDELDLYGKVYLHGTKTKEATIAMSLVEEENKKKASIEKLKATVNTKVIIAGKADEVEEGSLNTEEGKLKAYKENIKLFTGVEMPDGGEIKDSEAHLKASKARYADALKLAQYLDTVTIKLKSIDLGDIKGPQVFFSSINQIESKEDLSISDRIVLSTQKKSDSGDAGADGAAKTFTDDVAKTIFERAKNINYTSPGEFHLNRSTSDLLYSFLPIVTIIKDDHQAVWLPYEKHMAAQMQVEASRERMLNTLAILATPTGTAKGVHLMIGNNDPFLANTVNCITKDGVETTLYSAANEFELKDSIFNLNKSTVPIICAGEMRDAVADTTYWEAMKDMTNGSNQAYTHNINIKDYINMPATLIQVYGTADAKQEALEHPLRLNFYKPLNQAMTLIGGTQDEPGKNIARTFKVTIASGLITSEQVKKILELKKYEIKPFDTKDGVKEPTKNDGAKLAEVTEMFGFGKKVADIKSTGGKFETNVVIDAQGLTFGDQPICRTFFLENMAVGADDKDTLPEGSIVNMRALDTRGNTTNNTAGTLLEEADQLGPAHAKAYPNIIAGGGSGADNKCFVKNANMKVSS